MIISDSVLCTSTRIHYAFSTRSRLALQTTNRLPGRQGHAVPDWHLISQTHRQQIDYY